MSKEANIGIVKQVIGPVVDIEFPLESSRRYIMLSRSVVNGREFREFQSRIQRWN